MTKNIYNPMSKEFQDEAKRLGLTGRQLTEKYRKEGKSIKKDELYVRSKRPRLTRICCNCDSFDTYIDSRGIEHWYRHKCKKDICTGYVCNKCSRKDYQKNNPNSQHNLIKSVANFRTGNLDQNSATAKAIKSQELACILYGWEDLNKKHDNHKTPLDCYNPKTGLYHQVQGRYYNSERGYWSFTGFEREWRKIFETLVCFCISEDGQTVERIYKIPLKEIIENERIGATIVKNNSKGVGWYEEYRVIDKEELKKADKIWKDIEQ